MKLTKLSILLLILTCACAKQDDNGIVNEQKIKEYKINTTPTKFSENTLFPNDATVLNDTYLAVYEPKLNEGFIQIYDRNTYDLIDSIGNKGLGPEDFDLPLFLSDYALKYPGKMGISGTRKLNLYEYQDSQVALYNEYEIPSNLRVINFYLLNNDSLFVCAQSTDHQITVYNKNTGDIRYIDNLPDYDDYGADDYLRTTEVYNSSMTSDGNKVAIGYERWKVIDIVDLETGALEKRLLFPDYLHNESMMSMRDKYNLNADPEMKRYFTLLRSTPDYIFALCLNQTRDESAQPDNDILPVIYKLDWDGNIICKYVVDRNISNYIIADNEIKYVIARGDDGEYHIMECEII